VGAPLNNPAFVQDHNLISLHRTLYLVRNEDRGAFRRAYHQRLDDFGIFVVQSAGGFVHQQDGSLPDNGSRNGDALFLSP
jgi:hypothetical protein